MGCSIRRKILLILTCSLKVTAAKYDFNTKKAVEQIKTDRDSGTANSTLYLIFRHCAFVTLLVYKKQLLNAKIVYFLASLCVTAYTCVSSDTYEVFQGNTKTQTVIVGLNTVFSKSLICPASIAELSLYTKGALA